MAWYSQKISGFPVWIFQSRQNQIAITVIAMEQKAVISKDPGFSGEKTNILGFNCQNLAARFIIKGQNFRIFPPQSGPHPLVTASVFQIMNRNEGSGICFYRSFCSVDGPGTPILFGQTFCPFSRAHASIRFPAGTGADTSAIISGFHPRHIRCRKILFPLW